MTAISIYTKIHVILSVKSIKITIVIIFAKISVFFYVVLSRNRVK